MNKPTLLLLPGLPCDARLWTHAVTHLGEVCTPVVADLTVAETITGLAEAVLERAPPGPFALAGLSMGGYTAFEILRQAPERVMALALLDTGASADTELQTGNRQRMIEAVRQDFPAVIESLLPKLVHPDRVHEPAVGGLVRVMAASNGAEAFIRQQRAIMSRPDSRPELADIHIPTLVLCGREDALIPLEVHEDMAATIPDAVLEVLDDCGHLSPLEQPAQVSAALRRWLETAR